MNSRSPPNIVISPAEAAHRLGISLSTLSRLRKAGTMPPPIRLSTRRIGWRIADLDSYLSHRAQEAQGDE